MPDLQEAVHLESELSQALGHTPRSEKVLVFDLWQDIFDKLQSDCKSTPS